MPYLKKDFWVGTYLEANQVCEGGSSFFRLHLLDRVMHWIVKTAPSSSASL